VSDDDEEAAAVREAVRRAVMNYTYRKPRKKKADGKKPDDGDAR
jgi:hypothetical protein